MQVQGDLMPKFASPGSKRWQHILKISFISLFPNVPGSQNNNLSEEWVTKLLLCQHKTLLNGVTLLPVNL